MLPDGRTYYEFLEVSMDASSEVIRASARALLKRYHPDADGTHQQACWLNEAKATLLSLERRAEYDAELRANGKLDGAGVAQEKTGPMGGQSYPDPFHWQRYAAEDAVRAQAADRERRRRSAEEKKKQERHEAEAEKRHREAIAEEMRKRREEKERESNRAAASEAKMRRHYEAEMHQLRVTQEHQLALSTLRHKGKAMTNLGLIFTLLATLLAVTVFVPDIIALGGADDRENMLALLAGASLLLGLGGLFAGWSNQSKARAMEQDPPVVHRPE